MPFALIFAGLMLIITGFQNTYQPFGKLVAGDFTGPNNFIYWVISISLVGALGYNKDLQPFSRAFMGLIILDMIISNKGVFAKLNTALSSGTSQSDTTIGASLPGSGTSGSSSSSGGFNLGNIGQDASIAASVASFF